MAILELVTFKLAKGISDEAFLAENEHLNNWAAGQIPYFGKIWKPQLLLSKVLVMSQAYKV